MIRITKRLLSVSSAKWAAFPRLSAINISEEVQRALNEKIRPVISLESTIITHGLPYPQNLEMARTVEQTIRDNGGVPATCAFIKGIPYVGLADQQLEALAEAAATGSVNKVSRRDIGYTMSNKINGGTTIASTMILSHMAGIKVFATGGLGGVHKDGHLTFDVSADLTELGRTPVSVVCAGPKSILDIPLTMEYLETQGVFVSTFNDDGRAHVEVPGFYCRESGVKSPYSFNSFESVAATIHNQNNIMQLTSGSIICVPPPPESALSSSFINEIIDNANKEAKEKGISGKELTPFLLGKIAKDTQGKSVECNIKFVLNNAKIATHIGKELLRIENSENWQNGSVKDPLGSIVDSIGSIVESFGAAVGSFDMGHSEFEHPAPSSRQKIIPEESIHTLVVGSVAVDTIATSGGETKYHDSNPGSVRSSIGGVGYNINLAANYASQASSSRLVSIIGDDLAGKSILEQMEGVLDTSGVLVAQGATAQYTSTHSADGELIVAVADMNIVETDFSEHIIAQIERSSPKLILFDCNLSPKIVSKVLSHIKDNDSIEVVIEPTSFAKASRVAEVSPLSVFPNNKIKLITPTVQELGSLHKSFTSRGLFNDYDSWFPVLDSLGIDSLFREKLNASGHRHKVMNALLDQGVLQSAFQLLPYFSNILIKLGDQGVLLVSISTSIDDYKSIPTTSQYKPQFILSSTGQTINDTSERMGVVVQYFKIPQENEALAIRNVTGAGDTLIGYLVANLSKENWLNTEVTTIEQEWAKWESIYKAQLASGASLESDSAISDKIRLIR